VLAKWRYLLGRSREHRESLSVYDAAYVALAELLDIVLVTADVRLASAPGLDCRIDVLQ
jgi:predicted nucleic acid-binding protein